MSRVTMSAVLRELIAAGVSGDALVAAVERLEGARVAAKSGAERTAAWRQRRSDETSDAGDAGDVTAPSDVTPPSSPSPPPSPTPPTTTSTTSPSHPPIVPPPSKSAKAELNEAAEAIWRAQPVVGGKRRSTRPDVSKALAIACRDAPLAEIVAACEAFYRLPDCRKDGGQFAKGAEVLLRNDRWREFANRREPDRVIHLDAEQRRRFERHFRQTGEWKPEWGERPEEPERPLENFG